MKIFVIDDEPFVLRLLTQQLERLGYSDVIAYESAQAALESLSIGSESVGLIFLDLQMPDMDGVEFVRALARLGYSGGLILVSGEDERILQAAERLAKAQKLDVLGTLRKPATTDQLQKVLESNLLRAASAQRPRKIYDSARIRQAIESGELVNHYQPKVHVESGVVGGVETLVRWQHPQDGLVFPDQFIAVAEDNDLIDALTRAVLVGAMRDAGHWREAGIDLQVAVNVSMENLRVLEFPEFVVQAAYDAGMPVSSLMLEVTESRLMNDAVAPLDILTRLRLKRIGLSIDDFGTGHSSLAQLRDLPFQELKIDRGFVHGASRDASLSAIFEASLDLAHQLGMKAVAEGVEDKDDWDFLRSAGCDVAQGYFIARPMAPAAVPAWLERWNERRDTFIASPP